MNNLTEILSLRDDDKYETPALEITCGPVSFVLSASDWLMAMSCLSEMPPTSGGRTNS